MMDHVLGSNLLAWSLQVTLLSAIAWLTLSLLRIHAPTIRYAVWRALLAICLALPLLQPWQAAAPAEIETPALAAIGVVSPSANGAAAPLQRPPAAAQAFPWFELLGFVLVAGAAARLAWLGAGLLRLRRLRKAGSRAATCGEHEEVAKLIEAGAEIRYIPIIGQPVTFGFRRPVVLLPESFRSLPGPVQRAVLAHELWHVRRRDWAWILIEECIRAVFWFHPAIWFVVSRIQSAREEVVDELTVTLTNSRRSYLEALLLFAEEPPIFAAAPFARRRHLFQRMLLISREAVMSSRRIAVSGALMVAVTLVAGWAGASAFPLKAATEAQTSGAAPEVQVQTPPRVARPGEPRPPTNREIELQKAIAAAPQASLVLYFDQSRLQENRGALAEAEATLLAGRAAFPNHAGIRKQLASFYMRHDQFDRLMAMLENDAAADPSNPAGHHLVATYYEEKARKDGSLTPSEKSGYIQSGIAAEDRALTYNPDYVDALVYKNILLRHQAAMETDRGRREALIAEANTLRQRALELRKQTGSTTITGATIPPPPPPPPSTFPSLVDGQAPVRVGGNIKPPTKVRDVRPVYPPVAQQSRVQGVVILEILVDTSGQVSDARVLRSIPLLDEAAQEAVRQWEFTPTLLNGAAVPVIMTVTVNFTLE
jgi:TonB family protein